MAAFQITYILFLLLVHYFQSTYNWDILLFPNLATWVLTLFLIYPLHKGFWVSIARKTCLIAQCKIQPNGVRHPSICGKLYIKYCIYIETKYISFFGKQMHMVLDCTQSVIILNTNNPILLTGLFVLGMDGAITGSLTSSWTLFVRVRKLADLIWIPYPFNSLTAYMQCKSVELPKQNIVLQLLPLLIFHQTAEKHNYPNAILVFLQLIYS